MSGTVTSSRKILGLYAIQQAWYFFVQFASPFLPEEIHTPEGSTDSIRWQESHNGGRLEETDSQPG